MNPTCYWRTKNNAKNQASSPISILHSMMWKTTHSRSALLSRTSPWRTTCKADGAALLALIRPNRCTSRAPFSLKFCIFLLLFFLSFFVYILRFDVGSQGGCWMREVVYGLALLLRLGQMRPLLLLLASRLVNIPQVARLFARCIQM